MAKRRGNSEGSVIKRKDGRWAAVITVGAKRVWFYGKTRREAVEKLEEAKAQLKATGCLPSSKLTVGEWLDTWLNEYAKPHVRPTTYERYETLIRVHIKPVLGSVRLKELRSSQLQQFYNEKLAEGLSPRTVRYLHATLHAAFVWAVRDGLLPRNPADTVVPPRITKPNVNPLTIEQVRVLLEAAKDDPLFYPALLLEVSTGLRRGELLGLRWRDVDLDNGVVHVQQSLVRTSQGPLLQEPKTARSRRSVLLPAFVAEVLKRQAGEPDAFIFAAEDGRPLKPDAFSKRFSKFLRKAGLPHIRFHDLRHTHATLLLNQGVAAKVIQERLGHSTIAVTMDIYSHLLPGLQEDAAARIDRLLPKKRDEGD